MKENLNIDVLLQSIDDYIYNHTNNISIKKFKKIEKYVYSMNMNKILSYDFLNSKEYYNIMLK